MKIIQVREVPDDVHRRLKARAAAEGRTLSELVRLELTDIARRPTLSEALERIAKREPAETGESGADAVRAGRAGR